MQIKIGPLCYSVETVKDLKNDEGDGLFGEIKYAGQIIRLEEEMTPERAFVVLWHEVLHAIDDQYRLCLGEQGVGTLATALVSLFQENPELRYGESSILKRALENQRQGDQP